MEHLQKYAQNIINAITMKMIKEIPVIPKAISANGVGEVTTLSVWELDDSIASLLFARSFILFKYSMSYERILRIDSNLSTLLDNGINDEKILSKNDISLFRT